MACILLLAYRIHAILLYFGFEHANVYYIFSLIRCGEIFLMSFRYGFVAREKLILIYLQDLYISSYIKRTDCHSRQAVFFILI